MANLGPQKINLTYPGLLQVPNGLTASLQNIQDGSGNTSTVQISLTAISGQINTDAAVITGGSINGTVIGNVNPAVGTFSNLTATGTTTLNTSYTGLLKATAGVVSVASAGTDYVSPAVLGVANGVATLDASAKLTASQIPSIAITSYLGTVANQAAMLALTGQEGDWCIRSDLGTSWVISGTDPSILANWTELSYPTAPVTSVNSLTGAVVLSYTNVGAAPATTGSSILYANGSGGFADVTVGTGLSFAGGTLSNTVTGTVSSVSVVSANGFTGSVADASTTPAITIATSVTGVLKGNGTAISAAVSGTDYAPATTGTDILKGNGSGGFSSAVANTDYQGVITATGLLKGAGAGSISAATVGVDYAPATTGTAILKGNGTGGFSNAVSGTDYAPATSGTSILKGSGSGGFTNAVSGTDYAPATTGSSILYADGSGGFSSVTVGSGLSFTGGTLTSTSSGGSVTFVSVSTANGFAGTVANASTTPDITLTTTVTGLLKGNGTAISAATSGTDYAPATSGTAILKGNGAGGFTSAISSTDYAVPTSGTSILYGNGSGGFSNVTVGSGLSFTGGTLSATTAAVNVSNDTSTATNLYPIVAASTTGTIATVYTSNANYLYKPSTGELQALELVATNGIVVNSATVSTSYSIPSGSNASSAGPIAVASGVTVTVPSGSTWVVV
jgi:hypothetical protein